MDSLCSYVELQLGEQFHISEEKLLRDLDNWKNDKDTFNMYDSLYNECDQDIQKLNECKQFLEKTDKYFSFFDNIENGLKGLDDLDVESAQIMEESKNLTAEIVDHIKELKNSKCRIQEKENIYNKIVNEYSLRRLCFDNLMDCTTSLNIDFFEYLNEFEYVKKNVLQLLNEQTSGNINKIYSTYYRKITNSICKKMSLYIIKENNNFYKNRKVIWDLLLCPIHEEHMKRIVIIKIYIAQLAPLTKLCYKNITQIPEYFNLCLNNFLYLRKKIILKNHQELMNNSYKHLKAKKIIETYSLSDSVPILKNFLSIIYYLIILEDTFFRVLFSFHHFYTNHTSSYITMHKENIKYIVFNIMDSLYDSYKKFLDTNLPLCPKNYESYYELFQLFTIFIFKLNNIKKDLQINSDIKKIFSDALNDAPLSLKTQTDTSSKERKKKNDFFLEHFEKHLIKVGTKKCKGEAASNSFLKWDEKLLNERNHKKKNKTENNCTSNTKEQKETIKEKIKETVTETETETEKTMTETVDGKVLQGIDKEQTKNKNKNKNKSSRTLLNNVSNKDSTEKENSCKGLNTEINEKTNDYENEEQGRETNFLHSSSLQNYNCKFLNHTINIQKKLENEYMVLWQQNVVQRYVTKMSDTEKEKNSQNDDSLFFIKKIMAALNSIYAIYKNSSFYGMNENEQNFQNILDATINPLVNNCLKNNNQKQETDYICIVNTFTFLQESITDIEGSQKYSELLTIIIDEKTESLIQMEKKQLWKMLEVDKLQNLNKQNTQEVQRIVQNIFKFTFSKYHNQFNILQKITSEKIHNKMKRTLFDALMKEYENIYSTWNQSTHFKYTPCELKNVLFKNAERES